MGEDKIHISDRKQVHGLTFGEDDDFDDVDLLSDEEKAALKEDIEGEDEDLADGDKAAAEEGSKKAQEEADAKEEKEAHGAGVRGQVPGVRKEDE